MNKKAFDIKTLSSGKISNISNSKLYTKDLEYRGIANDKLIEPLPRYMEAPCEIVHAGENNARIIMGRDRPSNRFSGYGGRGDSQAGAIDIVVGLMGRNVLSHTENNEKVYADKNFSEDSARIYISQKTDIDRNFNLVPGRVGTSDTRSGVGIKADAVRIVGREGIKLVTKTDAFNSQGGEIDSVFGIDLIAGNDDSDLQPIPKGQNLSEAMSRVVEHVKNLTSILETFMTNQMKINTALAFHTHISPVGPTTPSVELISVVPIVNIKQAVKSLVSVPLHRTNLEMFKFNYLQPIGSKYINSRHNNTN